VIAHRLGIDLVEPDAKFDRDTQLWQRRQLAIIYPFNPY
jgi:hypothetical protein